MANNSGWVLDSSALLALLRDERGAEKVAEHAADAIVVTVNLVEVATVLMRRGASRIEVAVLLSDLKLESVPWTAALVLQGLDLNPLSWTHGLSLGDRACLTVARAMGRTALTADTAWLTAAKAVHPPIAVELFR